MANIIPLLERLTGQPHTFKALSDQTVPRTIGYSQLNELLLAFGFDRITWSFFQFLVDDSAQCEDGASLDLHTLEESVERFRRLAVLRFGNIKYAFKYFSQLDNDELAEELSVFDRIDPDKYEKRHPPVFPIDKIDPADTYYLGYMIEASIKARLEATPDDPDVQKEKAKWEAIVKRGIANQNAYLTSDHMDVYVATSMRERHEYLFVHDFCRRVFESDTLSPLNIRFFDPTQAYCKHRIDKGISEALMLKRAKCTIYLVQETDTLGKDSELASTLAQGKPVIAYVPRLTEEDRADYVDQLLERLATSNPGRTLPEIILEQLRLFRSDLAWTNSEVRKWCDHPARADETAMRAVLAESIQQHYDKRAQNLKDTHPLGIQVNLETGVANGVLVARSPEQCAKLVRSILLGTLAFRLDEPQDGKDAGFVLLREEETGSVFRVVTSDEVLTNSFWNFYL